MDSNPTRVKAQNYIGLKVFCSYMDWAYFLFLFYFRREDMMIQHGLIDNDKVNIEQHSDYNISILKWMMQCHKNVSKFKIEVRVCILVIH